jgi:hypothetical protein
MTTTTPIVQRFGAVDDPEFYLIRNRRDNRLLAKAWRRDEAQIISAALDLRDAVRELLPWMSLLGDYIGNGTMVRKDHERHGVPLGDDERCRAILRARQALNLSEGIA